MKKKKLTELSLKKVTVSKLDQTVRGGKDTSIAITIYRPTIVSVANLCDSDACPTANRNNNNSVNICIV